MKIHVTLLLCMLCFSSISQNTSPNWCGQHLLQEKLLKSPVYKKQHEKEIKNTKKQFKKKKIGTKTKTQTLQKKKHKRDNKEQQIFSAESNNQNNKITY